MLGKVFMTVSLKRSACEIIRINKPCSTKIEQGFYLTSQHLQKSEDTAKFLPLTFFLSPCPSFKAPLKLCEAVAGLKFPLEKSSRKVYNYRTTANLNSSTEASVEPFSYFNASICRWPFLSKKLVLKIIFCYVRNMLSMTILPKRKTDSKE